MKTVTKEIRGQKFNSFLFKDYNDQECSLTKSKLETENVIWFGVDEPRVLTSKGIGKENIIEIESRMLLTREQVKALLPILQKFVDIGVL